MNRQLDVNQDVVRIDRIVRGMRGGSQSQLIQGHDGRFYVAKFTGNPQGNRTLINEWVATTLLQRLGISVPPLVLLAYDPSSLKAPVSFAMGEREIPVERGLHLGSLCPVDPDKQVILDFLPRTLLERTVNLEDFIGILVADTFLDQIDRRQAIFVRTRPRQRLAFRALFIDHGMTFGGSAWELKSLKKDYLYFDRQVYLDIDVHSSCERILERIESLTDGSLLDMAVGIPETWFACGDYDVFACVCASLDQRKKDLRRLVGKQLSSIGLDCSKRSSIQPCRLAPKEVERIRLRAEGRNATPGFATFPKV